MKLNTEIERKKVYTNCTLLSHPLGHYRDNIISNCPTPWDTRMQLQNPNKVSEGILRTKEPRITQLLSHFSGAGHYRDSGTPGTVKN